MSLLSRCVPWLACIVAVAIPSTASAQMADPLNDLFAFGQGQGQAVAKVPTATRPEPPFEATPRARCAPGDRTEPGIQGRVPAGAATNGLSCNVTLLAHQGTGGGFKVYRYIDKTGRECAYYDTALLFPLNAARADVSSLGVAVIDMSDPSKPVQTDSLTEIPMLTPHESLAVNQQRGLIAAVMGNPSFDPGLVSIYDASADCRHPKLMSSGPLARLGHESGFAPDGKTFYATSVNANQITAIDVTDPSAPRPIWVGQVNSHGMSLNDAGTRAYGTDTGGELVILDTSEVQARKPSPQVKEIARLTWRNASIPQNAMPFTRDGKPYLLEFDEYTQGTTGGGDKDAVGAARIIDISDETQPRSIGNMRLQVNQPADHAAAANDPGAFSPVQGYAAHYCDFSSKIDPTVVACSFIASGLRVFDISDLTKPKEIAYYVAPTSPRAENGAQASSYAMSKPVIVPERKEVWYTDGTNGFNVLRVRDEAWPTPSSTVTRVCGSKRAFTVRVRLPKGARAKAVRATLGGRAVRGARQVGRYVRLRVDLRGKVKRTTALKVRVTLRNGRTVTDTRRYRTCTKRS